MKRSRHILFLASLCIFSIPTLKANDSSNMWWVSTGFGLYDANGISTFVSGNHMNQKGSAFKLNYSSGQESAWGNEEREYGDPFESFKHIQAMMGRGIIRQGFQVIAYTGLGITTGLSRIEQLSPSNSGIGTLEFSVTRQYISPSIPVQLDFTWKPVQFIEFGYSLFADLNMYQSFFGYQLHIGVGQFWKGKKNLG